VRAASPLSPFGELASGHGELGAGKLVGGELSSVGELGNRAAVARSLACHQFGDKEREREEADWLMRVEEETQLRVGRTQSAARAHTNPPETVCGRPAREHNWAQLDAVQLGPTDDQTGDLFACNCFAQVRV